MRLKQRILMKIGAIMIPRFRNYYYRLAGMRIGENTRVTSGLHIDRPEGIAVGNDTFINHFVHFHNGIDENTSIVIGDNVFIGPEVKFFCASHQMGPAGQRAGECTYGSIIVEDGAWIGANATIFPNVTISSGSVVGACAVVTKTTEPNGLYVGFPAKKIRAL